LYLQKAAERMKHQLRPADMLARLGGDEFGVLVSFIHDRSEAEEITHRLERCFDEPINVADHAIRGSASIGIALYPSDGLTDDAIMSIADSDMYVKKRQNKRVSAMSAERVTSMVMQSRD
jgi:diguanylate cyclase (GGDEF)-like protein